MILASLSFYYGNTRFRTILLLGLLAYTLFLISCQDGENIDNLQPPPDISPPVIQETVESLLDVYRTALLQEDIDRLQTLLPSEEDETFEAIQIFRTAMTVAFRIYTIIDLRIPAEDIHISDDGQTVSFLEVETVDDPVTMMRRTRAFRTMMQLMFKDEDGGNIFLRIAAINRGHPVVQVTTPGQVLAGVPARVRASELTGLWPIAEVAIQVESSGSEELLSPIENFFQGTFIPAMGTSPSLQVYVRGRDGEEVVFDHPYRLRQPNEWVVQQVSETGSIHRFFAVTAAPDGTVWAGGNTVDGIENATVLYQVPPGSITAALVDFPFEERGDVLVEDLIIDHLGRLHAVVGSPSDAYVSVLVHDRGHFCETVNLLDPDYPFLNPRGERSASARILAAGGGDVWLFGSDGGVARVRDSLQQAPCSDSGHANAHFSRLFRRQDGEENNRLLTNTVPALATGHEGALWFGTALGLMRWHEGQFEALLFERPLTLSQDQIDTLESVIDEIAEAIFTARPVALEQIGGVSFLELFGRTLIKEDFILSAVEDGVGRLWAGTLGGGLRRIEVIIPGEFRDTLHLTRSEVVRIDPDNQERTQVMSRGLLAGNIIFALAFGSDGSDDVLWAATDEGISRIREEGNGTFAITNFTVLDGLVALADVGGSRTDAAFSSFLQQFQGSPVRDITVDRTGTVWVVRHAGVFRIMPQSGQLRGVIHDRTGHSVMGADVIVLREHESGIVTHTPFRAVTDNEGRFVIDNLTPGVIRLQVDGRHAANGPFAAQEQEVEVGVGEQYLDFPLQSDTDGDGLSDEAEMDHGTDLEQVDTDGGGQSDGVEINVDETDPLNPRDDFDLRRVAVEADGTLVVGSNSILLRVDPDAGSRALLSGCTEIAIGNSLDDTPFPLGCIGTVLGAGPYFPRFAGVAVEVTGNLVVASSRFPEALSRIVRVDADTGKRTLISGCIDYPTCLSFVGNGPVFGDLQAIAIETKGTLVVGDAGLDAVIRVDPLTGDREIISDDTTSPFNTIRSIAVVDSDILVVEGIGNSSLRPGTAEDPKVLRIDPETGDRKILSDTMTGIGPPFSAPQSIAVEAEGTLVIVDSGLIAVMRVHPETGDREIISDRDRGIGPDFIAPVAIAVEADGTLVVVDGLNTLVRVDPVTGDRTIIGLNGLQ